ncbi:MAG TPA: ABC transporter ATP-binding protein [Methanothrix sp.]|nr:ABC transporter ATP-binding protein [Methanothrix sp.]
MLEVKKLTAFYGPLKVLDNISFKVFDNEIVSFIGPNGSGKSTSAKAIFGLVDKISGDIVFNDHDIKGLPPHELVKYGISFIPDGKRIFSSMTVLDNLALGGYLVNDGLDERIEKILDLFPLFRGKLHQKAGTLSGGEQQMLAIGKALMLNPTLLILDEPSLGLSPNYINTIFKKLREINAQGTAVLIIEQKIDKALEYAHRVYIFRLGKIIFEGPSETLLDGELRKSLLK